MDAMAPYRIPASALKADEASFEWDLGKDFFSLFDQEHEPIDARFHVDLELQRIGAIVTLEFNVQGFYHTTCDRCTTPIDMPVKGLYQIMVKPGDPAESTDEIIFIDSESSELNVGKHMYDFILLSIPISHRLPDCESMAPAPCDQSILSYLAQNTINSNPETEDKSSSPWDELKKVINN